MTKTTQLQIRVSPDEKSAIRQRAAEAGMDVSTWVLHQALPPVEAEFSRLCTRLADESDVSYALAEVHDFLARLTTAEFISAVRHPPPVALAPFEGNYLAAMIEYAATSRGVRPPDWTRRVGPLPAPWFASALENLRLYLLTESPAVFRARNLFVDSSVGDRV